MMSLSGSESVTVTDDSSTDVEPDSDKQAQTVTVSSKRTKKTTSSRQADVDEPQSAAGIVGGLAASPTKAKIRKVTNVARNYSAKNEASKPRSSADGKGSKAKRQIGTEKVGGMRRKRKAGDNYD